jgi:glycosyltransferase involved in cell wall biosynthesis
VQSPQSSAIAPADPAQIARADVSPRARPILICLSYLRWDFTWQRPHQLMSRAAALCDVVFVEEPMISDDVAVPRFTVRDTASGVRVACLHAPSTLPSNEVARVMRENMAQFATPGRPLLLWFWSPIGLPFVSNLYSDFAVYDCMDDLESFRGAPPELAALEDALLQRVQLVIAAGRTLFRSRLGCHPNMHLFPSSIDTAHFAPARQPGPVAPAVASLPCPRIGFFGVIDERMDVDLVAAIAARRPDWHLVMIGPTAKIDPGGLPRAPNIYWLGPVDYADRPRYLRGWNAGFMPFALNDATRHISPTKTPEFLAAGLPVVSTSVAYVVHDWGHVIGIADGPDAFVTALETALRDGRSRTSLERVDLALARSSWDRTWQQIANLSPPLSAAKGGDAHV